MPTKVREAIRIVTADGWRFVRQKGSHRQYAHPVKPGVVTISGKKSADLNTKTYQSIRKQAGLE